jgi:mannan endo-1,4-beta-mannosidase
MLLTWSSAALAQIDVSYTINADSGRSAISPYIYGINWDKKANPSKSENYSFVRLGGNRATSYNWENNASNAGADWLESSDDYWCDQLSVPAADKNKPAIIATTIIDQALKYNAKPLITLQMAGYVAADKSGTVNAAAPNSRWCPVMYAKDSAYLLTPNLTDGKVYMDEYVNFLKSKYGAGSIMYALDNEPDLWKGTHPLIHAQTPTCKELIVKSTALAKAVKAVDKEAQIFGFVSYGFGGYLSYSWAPDWAGVKGSYSWFIDYYLDQMKLASDTAGMRLVDVLDLHWYPEAKGNNRITLATANTDKDKAARLQAPRSLWDGKYVENSWIAQTNRGFLPLIPKLQNSINKYYPDTKLAFTEFNYGGYDDITGAIALTDVLGIFGKYGIYASSHWGLPGSYGSLAYQIYRNYDGNSAAYGNTNVGASMSDKVNSSVYASVESNTDSVLHIIVLNKSMTSTINGSYTIKNNGIQYKSAAVYAINSCYASIVRKNDISITDNVFTYALPAQTVYHFILKTSKATDYIDTTKSCSSQDTTIHTSTDLQSARTIDIYPNPASNVIRLKGIEGPSTVNFYNTTGSLVKTAKVSAEDNTISIEMIKDGIYLLEVKTSKTTTCYKLIKQ